MQYKYFRSFCKKRDVMPRYRKGLLRFLIIINTIRQMVFQDDL